MSEHTRVGGMTAVALATAGSFLAAGVFGALLLLLLLASPRGPVAGSAAQAPEAPASAATPLPKDLADLIAARYPGWIVESAFWGEYARADTSDAATAFLRSGETAGFRHAVVFDVTPGGNGSAATVEPRDDGFFDAQAPGFIVGREAGFERLWASEHPNLVCGPVYPDDERDVDYPLEAFKADAFTTGAAEPSRPAGTFSFRYDFEFQKWDTDSAAERIYPVAITVAKARARAVSGFPAFRVVAAVKDPPVIGLDASDVLVVLRSRSVPGFLWTYDPLHGTLKEPSLFMDNAASVFLKKADARSGAFMRQWAKKHPGTVLAEVTDFSDTGPAFDFVGLSYWPSLASVRTSDELIYAEARYHRSSRSWSFITQ